MCSKNTPGCDFGLQLAPSVTLASPLTFLHGFPHLQNEVRGGTSRSPFIAASPKLCGTVKLLCARNDLHSSSLK